MNFKNSANQNYSLGAYSISYPAAKEFPQTNKQIKDRKIKI